MLIQCNTMLNASQCENVHFGAHIVMHSTLNASQCELQSEHVLVNRKQTSIYSL